jgi:ribonuclease D
MGPATVQLSTVESSIVVHLAKQNGKSSLACTPMLEAILHDSSIVKAGCQIDDDLLELRNLRIPNLEATNRLDLCGLGRHQKVPGLKRLTASILGLDLPKHKRLSASDWSQVPLTEKQIVYAARDAWAAAAIMDHLASVDESVFGPRALAERLQSFELSLGDICRRQKNRKQAKALLSAILPRNHQGSAEFTELPPWKLAVVRELKSILQANRRERSAPYHVPSMEIRYNHTVS